VELGEGTFTLSGFARAMGSEIFVQVAGGPTVTREGWLGLRIDDVRVGQLPAPARLRETLTRQFQAPLREWSLELGARLDHAVVQDGRLVLEGTVRPPPGRSGGTLAPAPRRAGEVGTGEGQEAVTPSPNR
jgi:hypothetical protein